MARDRHSILRLCVAAILIFSVSGPADAQSVTPDGIHLADGMRPEPLELHPLAVWSFRKLSDSGFEASALQSILEDLWNTRDYEILEHFLRQIGGISDPPLRNDLLRELEGFIEDTCKSISLDAKTHLLRGYGIALFAAPYFQIVPSVSLDVIQRESVRLLLDGDSVHRLEAVFWLMQVGWADSEKADTIVALLREREQHILQSDSQTPAMGNERELIDGAIRIIEAGDHLKLTLQDLPETEGLSVGDLLELLNSYERTLAATPPVYEYVTHLIRNQMTEQDVTPVLDAAIEHHLSQYREFVSRCFLRGEKHDAAMADAALRAMLRHYRSAEVGSSQAVIVIDALLRTLPSARPTLRNLRHDEPPLRTEWCPSILAVLSDRLFEQPPKIRWGVYEILKGLHDQCPDQRAEIATVAHKAKAFELVASRSSQQRYALDMVDEITE